MTEFRLRPLSDLFEIDKAQISKSDYRYSTLPFVGLENIESHTKRYLPEFISAPEGMCNRFTARHILYGKLRPYLNKVFLPDFDGKCSTEIVPLQSKNGYSRNFVSIILQSQTFIEEAVKHSTGGRMPRANLKHLLKLKVSVPEAEEANAIARDLQSQLTHVESMRQAALKQKEAAKALQSAILREVFPWQAGESLPSVWKNSPLSKICNIKTGKLDVNAAAENGAYPFFTCAKEIYQIDKYSFDCHAVLLAGNNASGDFNVKIYKGKFNAYQRVYVITLKNENELLLESIYWQIELALIELKKLSQGSNTKFLKIGWINNIPIFYPETKEKQNELLQNIEHRIDSTNRFSENIDKQFNHVEALPSAILREAFNFEIKGK